MASTRGEEKKDSKRLFSAGVGHQQRRKNKIKTNRKMGFIKRSSIQNLCSAERRGGKKVTGLCGGGGGQGVTTN